MTHQPLGSSSERSSTDAGHPVGDRNDTQTLSVIALVLAFLIPVAGLVVAIVANSRSKRDGRTADGMTLVTLIISSVIIGLGLMSTAVALIFFLITAGHMTTTSSVAAFAPKEITVKVTSGGATVTDGDLLTAAKAVTTHRLQRAKVQFSLFGANSQGLLVVIFPESASAAQMNAAKCALTVPTDPGFRKVLGLGDPTAGAGASFSSDPAVRQTVADKFSNTDCNTISETGGGVLKLDGGLSVYCDLGLKTKYLVGDILIPGDVIADHTATRTSIELDLNGSGTPLWSNLSTQLSALPITENQITLVIGNEVVVAPTMNDVVTNGKIAISSSDASFDAALIDSELALASSGISFSVD